MELMLDAHVLCENYKQMNCPKCFCCDIKRSKSSTNFVIYLCTYIFLNCLHQPKMLPYPVGRIKPVIRPKQLKKMLHHIQNCPYTTYWTVFRFLLKIRILCRFHKFDKVLFGMPTSISLIQNTYRRSQTPSLGST